MQYPKFLLSLSVRSGSVVPKLVEVPLKEGQLVVVQLEELQLVEAKLEREKLERVGHLVSLVVRLRQLA
jgi:hypothetical protein